MKIQVVSDLHLEFYADAQYTGITPAPGADALVIAGDIGVATSAVARFRHWPVPVVYVHGNHELYAGGDLGQTVAELRLACAGSAIHFLEKDALTVAGFPEVRFLGTCMWTDYLLFGRDRQSYCMEACAEYLRDHTVIRTGGRKFLPRDARLLHDDAKRWLGEQLATPFDGRTVVVTHHGPHWNSIAERYRQDPASAGFASDLSLLLGLTDLWLHGHTHDSVDYTIGPARVIANPRGYPQKTGACENPSFKAHLVIDM